MPGDRAPNLAGKDLERDADDFSQESATERRRLHLAAKALRERERNPTADVADEIDRIRRSTAHPD